jgi:hypothetical protein
MAVGQPQQQFLGAVFRDLVAGNLGREQIEVGGETFPQRFGNVMKLVERDGPLAENPAADLIGTKWPLAGVCDPCGKFVAGESQ